MNEIAELIHEKTGLSEEESAQLARSILGLIVSKLPTEVQGFVTPFLNGGGTAPDGQQTEGQGGELGSILGVAEGLFGGHKG